MSDAKIPRGEFRNPCPDLKNPAAKTAVDSLLAKVSAASKRFGEPTEQDYEIASIPLAELQQRLVRDEGLTMARVVEARIRLTIKASLETHCLTAFPYEEALEQAHSNQLRIDSGANGEPPKILESTPLLGLVFSVKDCIHVKGYATTLGCSSRAASSEAATADIVQKMIKHGAIMIAKTTAPQLMMSNTTHSPLWGTTRSPIRSADADGDEFQVGGSSGGEAALVKMGGSQVGIGTDMGGSVRQPACLNELYGYKFTSSPDTFRWALPHDFMTGLPHTTVPATAPGLLARDMDTLKLVADYLHNSTYSNVDELTEDDPVDVDEDWEMPVPDDLGNQPRIVYTAQQASPEVGELVHALVEALQTGDELVRPTEVGELGDVDVKAWGEAWMDHAKQHGFDDARVMLADDPLIERTMFDESRLSASVGVDKAAWQPDSERLARLKAAFLRQARIGAQNGSKPEEHEAENEDEGHENVILITPTYTLGGPVQQRAFVQLDDAGESEIWCQIFNLLDWPAVSIPFPELPAQTRREFRAQALASPAWAQHLPGNIERDPIRDRQSESERERLPHLSLQLVTVPGNHAALLDYARRISWPL